MKSSWLRHTLALLLVAGLAAGSWACGGDEKKADKKKDELKPGQAAASGNAPAFVPVAKPEWDAVFPYFSTYVDGLRSDLGSSMAGTSIRDIFLDLAPKTEDATAQNMKVNVQAVKTDGREPKKQADAKAKAQKDIDSILAAIDSPTNSGKGAGTNPDGKGADLAPKDPLTAFPLQGYLVRIVMTGIANPEAFVEAPDGKTHILHRGDRLGSEGGLVVDLLKSKVLFRLPDREELVEVVMAPEITPTLLESEGIGAKDGKMR